MAFYFILKYKITPFYLLLFVFIRFITRCHSLSLIAIFGYSLSFVVTHCHSLSLVFIHCHLLSLVVIRIQLVVHSLSLAVPLVVTRCHSLSLVVIRCHSLCHSVSLVVTGTPCTTRLSVYKRSFLE